MKNYHLTKKGDNWALAAEHAQRATKVFEGATKQEAIKESAKMLLNSDNPASLKIHKLDGRIQEERTYPRSADPHETKG